jgi:hypothetical protein
MDTKDMLSLAFAALALLGAAGGIASRLLLKKGLGVQFIRYTALSVALPIAAALVFQDMPVAAMIAAALGALGYAFADRDKKRSRP